MELENFYPINTSLKLLIVCFFYMILNRISRQVKSSSAAKNSMIGSVYNYLFRSTNDQTIREIATNNGVLKDEMVEGFHPRLQSIFKQLDGIAPRFTLKNSNITILNEPSAFYSKLKEKILSAQERVFLSTLYIGKAQHELVDVIDRSLQQNPNLTITILTDALRGTREAPHHTCSASLLIPLVEKFGNHRIDIRMYHTPHLKGFTKSWTPKRINEAWGLQHMKLYGFDDEIMLSGANLSEDYFTDRQDRYYIFKHRDLTNYYHNIHNAVSSLSYQILPSKKNPSGFRMNWPTSNKSCEPHLNLKQFINDSSFLLEPLLKQQDLKNFELFDDEDNFDTIIYPVSQFTPLLNPKYDASTEKPAILRLLTFLDSPKIKWWFTAGYFNMLPDIQNKLVNGFAKGTIITASAKANSFYKSSGVSYYIPEAYLLIAKRFLEDVKNRNKENLIKLYEWQNGIVNSLGGWSYHAKGMWITVPEDELPSVTIIGSSNYTKRAYSLDLESNAIVITKDPTLKLQMMNEIDNLMKYAKELKLDDFEPKLKSPVPEVLPQLSGSGEAVAEEAEVEQKPVYEVDEDRRISYGVHLALKLIGGKL